ncbi:MAG: type IV pilus secretin PilQ [Myxococcota bacterium]
MISMLEWKTLKFQVAVAAALCGVLAMGACASSSAPPTDTAAVTNEVVDVMVDASVEGSTVTVIGPVQPIFTAFQDGDDRLIVDLASVSVGNLEGSIPVGDGLIESVEVEEHSGAGAGTMTRLAIALTGPADYEIQANEVGLEIDVMPLDAMADASGDDATGWEDDAAEEDPWAAETEEDAVADAETGWDGDEAQASVAAATVLSGVDASAVGEGSLIHLMANGSVETAVTFTLEDPARLVLDLPELQSEVKGQQVEVGSAQVSRVRVGAHADKVRVVVDGGSADAPFDGRRVIPVPTGLVVALGEGAMLEDKVASLMGAAAPVVADTMEALDEELPVETVESEVAETVAEVTPDSDDEAWAAETETETAWEETETEAWETSDEAPLAETTPDETLAANSGSGPVTIYGVEYDAQDETDRVMIMGESAVDYLVFEPEPETVILSISSAKISPDAAVRIAPENPGAVSLVTAFDQPDVETPEVRIVVKRAANLKPTVTRRGSVLIMDFPRSGGLAATPPAYQDTQVAQVPSSAPALGSDSVVTAPAPLTAPAAIAPPEAGLEIAGLPADAANGAPPAAIEILNEGSLMDGKEYAGRRISLDFKEVDIADVLRLIAEVSDLNVIAGDEVKGKVTIRLVDVPWDQALDVILLTKGLGFARIGNVLRIAAADVLAQEEELRLQERRAKEKLEDLVVKLQPVNYADVADVSRMVKELLTPRGSVNTDTRTNTLIIKDIASVIDEATALVKAVDTMTPQVMIEAKIVEASLDFSRELGSRWTFGANPATESTLGTRDYVFQQGDDDGIADGLGNQVVFGNPITAGPTGLLGLAASVLDQKFNFEVELQAAEVNGDGKVISSPRIVTLDNSTANIEQGVSIPFQTFENGDAQLEFVDAVLKLDVTPHITADASIIMEIEVSRNAPDDSVFTLTGSPAIAKNQVQTETLVKDGQTLVLGGIYVVDRSERESRVPYLSRLPGLGRLFKSNEYSDSRKELLVFVSPRIVQTPGGDAS